MYQHCLDHSFLNQSAFAFPFHCLVSSKNLGKSRSLFVLHFPHLQNVDDNSTKFIIGNNIIVGVILVMSSVLIHC